MQAQLHVDFSFDKNAGCSPLAVSFVNTTTGASADATFHWNFDNGNSSDLKNAGSIFLEERSYSVTLTVKDGSQTSTQTKTITVYKKPIVDFTVSPGKGCLSLPVTFTAAVNPGDGNISTYHWDFGDGSIQQVSSSSIIHNYTFEQIATVSLTAVNNYGCVATLTKQNIVTVLPPLQAGFTADKTIVCDVPAVITFTNTSSGPGTLSHQWDFGDGVRSTDANPVHTFTRKGIYTIKLIVTSSEGCVKEFVRNAYINVADFKTDFNSPSLVCTNNYISFYNISQPEPTQSTWIIDGTHTYYSYSNGGISHYFDTEGIHTVQLTNNFGPCQQSITKQIDVKKTPTLNGFLVDIDGLCGAPLTVNFRDTARDAVSWKWNFNWWHDNSIVHSTIQAPSYNYTSDNIYNVSLTIANASGCIASVIKTVGISKPVVGIFLDPDSRSEGCGPLTVKFESRSTDDISSYSWNFGDGRTSTVANPEHVYSQPGMYQVTLDYTTVNGCTGKVSYYDIIRVREKPVADFSIQSTVCGNTPVFPINRSTGHATNLLWNFGDDPNYYSLINTMHKYQQEGEYTVSLIAYNGMCNDTVTKQAIIKVAPPFPQIVGVENTCDNTRGEVKFTEASRQVTNWSWNFGDGSSPLSYNMPRSQVSHIYTRTGSYMAVLTTTNGSCTVKDSVRVYVLLKQKPVLSISTPEVCVNNPTGFTITGLEHNPDSYPSSWKYSFVQMEYDNGTPFRGSYYNLNSYWDTDVRGNLTSYEVREGLLRTIIVSSGFGCQDTTNYVPVKFKGVDAGFEIISDNNCFKSPVVLKDTSKTLLGGSITSGTWHFGDGSVKTLVPGETVSHIYNAPGSYYVELRAQEESGCSSNSMNARYVNVSGPKAAFNLSTGNVVQLNTTVQFYNYTNTYNVYSINYLWDFGNGATSTEYSPTYTFNVAGTYVITLIAENAVTQCRDTARQTITVKDFNTGFITNTSFIGNYSQCPPVLARFTNTSSNYTKLVWDFGDGFTLENQPYPSHIYNTAGTYIVTLFVYGYNGLTGTFKDTVHVGMPVASIYADDLEGCIGDQLSLYAPSHNEAVSYLWDFGNGQLVNATDSFATHKYLYPGTFTPSLLVKNVGGCMASVTLPDKIVIHPEAVFSITPVSPVVCKTTPVQLQANAATSYAWSPSDGLSDPHIASPLASPTATTTYHLNATDANGCDGSGEVTVIVAQPFVLHAAGNFDVCKGDTIQLNVTGAHTYQWINNTEGLNNTQIANPTATPIGTTQYTITGFDQYQCYSDTASITVHVRSLPYVNAGPDREAMFGSENTLNVNNSTDVVRWNWSPADFLSCTRCPAPVSKPYSDIDYIVTVFNSYNCSAKDTLHINAFCTDARIYIPSAFSPDNNGKNEVFMINGTGISIIRSLRIFNRWGEIVFQRKNFYPGDNVSAWNGIYKGVEAPAGTYVYFAEMECESGQHFERKGTVTLVR